MTEIFEEIELAICSLLTGFGHKDKLQSKTAGFHEFYIRISGVCAIDKVSK